MVASRSQKVMRPGRKGASMTIPSLRPRLLLVEDDPDLSQLLAELLDEEGYAVTAVRDGQAGLHRGLVDEWDVLVVDRGLPGIEGVDLVTLLRSRGLTAPVLFLTARGTVADRVEGLDAGAQDYVVKPFDVEEVLARLRAMLRPVGGGASELVVGDRRLVVGEQRLVGGDGEVMLSGREARLLETLPRRRSRASTRNNSPTMASTTPATLAPSTRTSTTCAASSGSPSS